MKRLPEALCSVWKSVRQRLRKLLRQLSKAAWFDRDSWPTPAPLSFRPQLETLEKRIVMTSGMTDPLYLARIGLPAAASPAIVMDQTQDTDQTTGNGNTGSGNTSAATYLSNPAASPVRFVANSGQTDPSVAFMGLGLNYQAFFGTNEITLALSDGVAGGSEQDPSTTAVVQINLLNTNNVLPTGQQLLTERSNYLVGSDSSQWQTNVFNYGQIVYKNIYNDIDLVFQSSPTGQLEYSWIVHPGADPSQIQMQINTPGTVQTDDSGNLVLGLTNGQLTEQNLNVYQQAGTQQQAVSSQFVVGANNTVGFQVGSYDNTQTLVIDPSLTWSTYLGGSGSDSGQGIAVDAAGNVYVTGDTSSSNFPTLSGYSSSYGGSGDTFVTKYSPTGTMQWSTYVGGSGADNANALAVDAAGDTWVVGSTQSTNFPTASPLYSSFSGTTDGFVFKLDPTGSNMLFASYLGTASTTAYALALDASGNAFVGGTTTATNFPTTSGAYQTTNFDPTYGSGFVSKISASSYAMLWSSYLGSSSTLSSVRALAVDTSGLVYAAGYAQYEGGTFAFPTTMGAYQTSPAGLTDAFLTKFNSTGTGLSYSTLYGGMAGTTGTALAVDSSGDAYLVGLTTSSNLHTTSGAYQTSLSGTQDAFAAKFNSLGTGLVYGTYLGTSTSSAQGAVVNGNGQLTVAGWTTSTTFPTVSPVQSSSGGGTDAFISQLSPSGNGLSLSSYYGGSGTDQAWAVAQDTQGDIFFTGQTASSNLPTVNSSQGYGGSQDAFVAEVNLAPPVPAITAISPDTGYSSTDQITNSQNLTLSGTGPSGATITIYRTDLNTALGTATVSSGTWSFNYSGTTLPAGSYAFQATSTVSSVTSARSTPFHVTVDLTAPTVSLTIDSSTAALSPQLLVTATDNVGIPATTTVTIDVDLLDDGSFTDPGDAGYATGTMTNGVASFMLSPALAIGSYHIRADVYDKAGNKGSSASQAFTVTTLSGNTLNGPPVGIDPLNGNAQLYQGTLNVSQLLDLDQSPGTSVSNNTALVYNSDRVSAEPIISVQVQTENTTTLPSTISAQLTWNGGTPQATQTYSTTGLSTGELLTLAQQVSSPVSVTGLYNYSLTVVIPYATPVTMTFSGTTAVIAEDSSAYGSGWTLSGVDRLYSVTGGVLREYGSGGWGYYPSTGTYTYSSPSWDTGTLTGLMAGGYQYVLPDGETWNYNSSGYLTSYVSADGLSTTTYTWSSGLLSTITTPDGAVSTFTYSSGKLSTIATGGRTVTMTVSGGDLTQITNADSSIRTFGYSSNKLISDSIAGQPTTYAYSDGVLDGWTSGSGSTAGSYTLVPEVVPGLSALIPKPAGASYPLAFLTDPLGNKQSYALDNEARVLDQWDPTGDLTQTPRNGLGLITASIDPLGNATSYAYDSDGYVTLQTNPDGGTVSYSYDSTSHHDLTAMTDVLGNLTTMTYDSYGHMLTSENSLLETTTQTWSGSELATVTDPLGNTTAYAYDSDLRLTATTAPDGGVMTQTYDSNGNVATVENALTYTTTYANDALGRVTLVTDADSHTNGTAYNGLGQATSESDGKGTVTAMVYDSQGEQTSESDGGENTGDGYNAAGEMIISWDAAGNATTYAYNPDGELTSETDPAGNVTQYLYDHDGNMTTMVDSRGEVTLQSYNGMGELTSATDALGNISTTGYNKLGEVTSQTNGLSQTSSTSYDVLGEATSTTDQNSKTSTMVYDADGVVTSSTDALGKTTTTSYSLATDTTVTTDPDGDKTTMVYDKAQELTQTTDADGNITTNVYDPAGNETVSIDGSGNTTTMAYDQDNQVTVTTNPLGLKTTTLYDALERVTKSTDPAGDVTQTMWDTRNNQVETTDPVGKTTVEQYNNEDESIGDVDDLGKRSSENYDSDGNATSATDDNGNITLMQYDKDNRLTSETDADGNTTQTSYNAGGEVTSVTDALGHVTNYGYDADDRQTSVTDATGTSTTSFDYDGQVTQTTDGMGDTVYSYYDPAGRVTATSNGIGTTSMAYDKDGNLTTETDPDGNVTTFQYDKDGDQTVTINPLGNKTTTVYDSENRVSTVTDADGQEIIYSYDNANRETGEVWKNSGGTTVNTLTFTYDADSNELTASNSAGTYTMAYDGDNRMTSESGLFGVTLTSTYDANSNRTGLQDSLGGTMTVAYNADNEWTSMQWNGTGMSAMMDVRTYTADNQKATDARYDSLTVSSTYEVGQTSYTWSTGGDLTNETFKNGSGSTTLQQVTYTYSSGLHQVASRDLNGTTVNYSYDAANELTNDGVATYTYDSNGNRTMTGYSTGTGNQLLNDGTYTYTYDNDGNMIEKSEGTGLQTWFYTYDNKGHLLTVNETSNGVTSIMTATYTYDAFGNMVKEVEWQTGVGTTTTEHVYDQLTGNLLLDLNSSNALVMRYMSGDTQNEYLGRQDGSGNTSWYMTDRLGSVIGITNGSGTATDTIVYDAFGNKTSESAPSVTGNLQFQGMYFDVPVGEDLDDARPYNPETATFGGMDPDGFGGGSTNLYSFTNNDPTNATDPTGLATLRINLNYYVRKEIDLLLMTIDDSVKTHFKDFINATPTAEYAIKLLETIGKAPERIQKDVKLAKQAAELGVLLLLMADDTTVLLSTDVKTTQGKCTNMDWLPIKVEPVGKKALKIPHVWLGKSEEFGWEISATRIESHIDITDGVGIATTGISVDIALEGITHSTKISFVLADNLKDAKKFSWAGFTLKSSEGVSDWEPKNATQLAPVKLPVPPVKPPGR